MSILDAWATPENVHDVTRQSVTEDQIVQAQFIVELFAGTTIEASDAGNISSTNLRLLMLAVVYQTVWMAAHPDIYTNMDVDSFSHDGVSGTKSTANANLLAPLAQRCISRLSWRHAPLRAHRRGQAQDTGSRDSAVRDDERDWVPIGGGV